MAALNEEKGIGLTLREVKDNLEYCKFLVVDGNSIDDTVKIAQKIGAEVIHQKGKGKGDAISYAIKHIKNNPDFVVLIDADCTYSAKLLPKMINILKKNQHVGIVCGNRFNTNIELGAMREVFNFGNRLVAFVHGFINGVPLQDPLTGLRVIRGSLLKNWQPKSLGFDIEVELNSYIKRQGYVISEVDIDYRKRVGQKKLKIKDGFIILKRIISESIV